MAKPVVTRDGRGVPCGIMATALLMLAGTPALADLFVLNDGEKIAGEIVQGTLGAVVIRRADGGIRQTSVSGIREVRIDGGERTISGRLISWQDGVFELEDNGERFRVANGQVLTVPSRPKPQQAEAPAVPPRAVSPPPPAARTAATATAATAAAVRAPAVPRPGMADRQIAADPSPATAPPPELIADVAAGERAPTTFLLEGGAWLQGEIIRALGQVVIVQQPVAGLRQIPVAQIEEVWIKPVDQPPVGGAFVGWENGAYELRAQGELLKLHTGATTSGGRVIKAPRQPAPAKPPQQTEPTPATVMPAARSDRAAAGDPPAPAQRTDRTPSALADQGLAQEPQEGPDQTARAADGGEPPPLADQGLEEAAEEALALAATQLARAAPGDRPVIDATAEPVVEGGEMVFTIKLSQPSEQSIVVVYATVDGTAVAGADYAPQQGIMTFAPGETEVEVRAPLIDDGEREGDKAFELFLTTDPRIADLPNPQIIATIEDDE